MAVSFAKQPASIDAPGRRDGDLASHRTAPERAGGVCPEPEREAGPGERLAVMPPAAPAPVRSGSVNRSLGAPRLAGSDRGLRVGVISSPGGYHNQRGGLDRMRGYLRSLPDVPHLEVVTPAEAAEGIETLERESIDVVTINGGDGSVSMVLTGLLRRNEPARMPLVAVLAGGRTNMTAGDVGLKGDPVRQLERLLRWARAGRHSERELVRRPVLSVQATPAAAPLFGLCFGAAAIYHTSKSCWDFRDASRVPGMRTGLGTAVHVVGRVGALLMGRPAFPPCTIGVRVDGRELPAREHAALFVTTLERLALGLRPFWGEGPGPLRLTAIAHRRRHLLKAAVHGLRGRRNRFLLPEFGYVSLNASAVDLEIGDGAVLDGEVILPEGGQPMRIRSGRFVDFVRP